MSLSLSLSIYLSISSSYWRSAGINYFRVLGFAINLLWFDARGKVLVGWLPLFWNGMWYVRSSYIHALKQSISIAFFTLRFFFLLSRSLFTSDTRLFFFLFCSVFFFSSMENGRSPSFAYSYLASFTDWFFLSACRELQKISRKCNVQMYCWNIEKWVLKFSSIFERPWNWSEASSLYLKLTRLCPSTLVESWQCDSYFYRKGESISFVLTLL